VIGLSRTDLLEIHRRLTVALIASQPGSAPRVMTDLMIEQTRREPVKIHVTGGKRGEALDLNINVQGSELDIINLIDDLDWAAVAASPISAARLRALSKAITDVVGLVADYHPASLPEQPKE
jgi:hypothetical protein